MRRFIVDPAEFNALPDIVSLDGDIEQLLQAVCDLKRQRNSRAAINQLPAEILSRIFLYCARHEEPLEDVDESEPPCFITGETFIQTIAFSYVCSYWRSVALSTPNLWSLFRYPQVDWVQELIERSRDTELTILLDDTLPSNIITLFLSQLPRVRELHFDMDEEMTALAEMYLEHYDAPRLEVVTFTTSAATVVSLPDTILLNSPRISSAAFYGCKLPWQHPLFSNLAELDLRNGLHLRSEYWLRRKDLIYGLTRVPHLRKLTVQECLASSPPWPKLDGPPIHLPFLKELDVSGDFNPVNGLFNQVSWSKLMRVHVVTDFPFSEDEEQVTSDFAAFTLRVCNSLSPGVAPPFRSLFLTSDLMCLQLRAFPEADPEDDSILNGASGPLELIIHCQTSSQLNNSAQSILRSLSLHPVEQLVMKSMVLVRPDIWLDTLFGRTSEKSQNGGLEQDGQAAQETPQPLQSALFPRLRALKFDDVGFTRTHSQIAGFKPGRLPEAGAVSSDDTTKFYEAVQTRWEQLPYLEQVFIDSAHYPPANIMPL